MTLRPFAAFLLAGALASAGCTSLPLPHAGAHPERGAEGYEDPVEVPYAPPPGKVKVVPPRPPRYKDPVWIDGQWEWKETHWQWREGGWEDQPPGKYYAYGIFTRLDDGTLVYKRGSWTSFPAKN